MAYLSKSSILTAYKKLSDMHPDPLVQGATQKVSAIRHFIALDCFYKRNQSDCDTRRKSSKDSFAELVGIVSDVCPGFYTTNFYFPLKSHSGDYCVGSNFYSAGQVSASLVNENAVFDYPKRGGKPLMKVKKGVLIRDTTLYDNLNEYIPSVEHFAALSIWLLRGTYIEVINGESVSNCIIRTLKGIFTDELISTFTSKKAAYERALNNMNLSFEEELCLLSIDDIKSLFVSEPQITKQIAVQKIFYGCPGTGKSRKVKELAEGTNGEKIVEFEDGTTNVYRTTFHPDYDYSTFVGCYKPYMKDGHLEYKFVPQVFTNAYVASMKHPDTPVYLIIEEINRGNCAQIFGDLFQLLDRKLGVSEFPIAPDQDLVDYLRDEAGLEEYKELRLPDNLNIYATMNTSDQSLFPMDSAFKRRWDMEYVGIDYDKKAADFSITINSTSYSWLEYLRRFNELITEASDSEDKQMGEFFIRQDMNAEEFKNKVMFYLWNDICKDLYAGKNSPQEFFFRDTFGKPFKFTQLFVKPKNGEEKDKPETDGDALLAGFLHFVMYGKEKKKAEDSATTAEATSDSTETNA